MYLQVHVHVVVHQYVNFIFKFRLPRRRNYSPSSATTSTRQTRWSWSRTGLRAGWSSTSLTWWATDPRGCSQCTTRRPSPWAPWRRCRRGSCGNVPCRMPTHSTCSVLNFWLWWDTFIIIVRGGRRSFSGGGGGGSTLASISELGVQKYSFGVNWVSNSFSSH